MKNIVEEMEVRSLCCTSLDYIRRERYKQNITVDVRRDADVIKRDLN